MTARTRFILREACIGAVLNALLSYGIFRLLFRGAPVIPLHGFGNFLFDFLPRALPAKALVLALAATACAALPMAGLVAVLWGETIDWTSASALKIAFGAGVSLAITPIALCSIIPAR